LSLNYRSKVVTKLEGGDATFEVPNSLAANFPNGKFDAELPLPGSFNVGITFPLSEKVDAAIDGSIINYDIYKELVFDYENNTPVLQDTRSEKNYENAFRSEEHTSELQSRENLVCRLLLEKKKTTHNK